MHDWNRDKYRHDNRYNVPNRFDKWISKYQIDSEELQYLEQDNPSVLYTRDLDLSVAQAPSDPLVINVPGRCVQVYGYSLGSKFLPVPNTGTEVAEPGVYVSARINWNTLEAAFPLKQNRGYFGNFTKLYLSWPAQANMGAKLVVYRYEAPPVVNGEADNRFNLVEASNVTTHTAGAVTNAAAVLLAADLSRKVSTIQNLSASPIYIGGSNVSTANGIQVVANGGIGYWRNTSALYAVAAVAGPLDVRLVTEY